MIFVCMSVCVFESVCFARLYNSLSNVWRDIERWNKMYFVSKCEIRSAYGHYLTGFPVGENVIYSFDGGEEGWRNRDKIIGCIFVFAVWVGVWVCGGPGVARNFFGGWCVHFQQRWKIYLVLQIKKKQHFLKFSSFFIWHTNVNCSYQSCNTFRPLVMFILWVIRRHLIQIFPMPLLFLNCVCIIWNVRNMI